MEKLSTQPNMLNIPLQNIHSSCLGKITSSYNADLNFVVFRKVNATYATPAVELNQNWEECHNLLQEKVTKLKEIRRLQNLVVANITKTESVNGENKKKLELVKNAITGDLQLLSY